MNRLPFYELEDSMPDDDVVKGLMEAVLDFSRFVLQVVLLCLFPYVTELW
jgi:hypothetical protein